MDFTIIIEPSRTQSDRWAWFVERQGCDGPSASGTAETREKARERAEACADELAQQIARQQTYTYTAGGAS